MTVSFAAEGTSELMGTAVIDGDAAFALGEDGCSGQEVVGECTIDVEFAPVAVGQHAATLRLSGTRGDAVVTLTAAAYATGAHLSASPGSLKFSPLGPGLLSPPQHVTVTAGGDLPVRILGLALEGSAPGDFVITADGCARTTLEPGMSCPIEVRANPSNSGGHVAGLRVLTDPAEASVTVGLVVLLPPPPPPGLKLVPPPWSFGIVAAAQRARGTTVRLYTSLPATVTVTLLRGRRSVRKRTRTVAAGFVKVIVKGRLSRGRYRVRVVAQRRSVRRKDSIRLRVR